MENQTINDCPEESQPSLLPPDRLSFICPGLGQLVQQRYSSFFWHFALLLLAIASMTPLFLPLFLFVTGRELVVSFAETGSTLIAPLLYLILTGLLLLFTPFLFTTSKRTLLKIYLAGFLALPVVFLFVYTVEPYNSLDAFGIVICGSLLVLMFFMPLLLIVPLALLSGQDAANWKQEKSAHLKIRLIYLTSLLALSSVYPGYFIPAIASAREAARRMQCCSHMKGLTLAFHNYHDVYGSFPPAYTVDKNGKPLHSWRVLILPFMEGQALYEKIRLDEPWDSEHNRQFHDMQEVYKTIRPMTPMNSEQICASTVAHLGCPSSFKNILAPLKNRKTFQAGNCNYSVVIGKETIFPGSKSTSFRDITDGTSNTILIVERIIPICWMDPNNEIQFDIACEGINRHLLGIGSEHPGGAYVGFADGSIHFLSQSADGSIHSSFGETFENMKPLLTKAAGDHSKNGD